MYPIKRSYILCSNTTSETSTWIDLCWNLKMHDCQWICYNEKRNVQNKMDMFKGYERKRFAEIYSVDGKLQDKVIHQEYKWLYISIAESIFDIKFSWKKFQWMQLWIITLNLWQRGIFITRGIMEASIYDKLPRELFPKLSMIYVLPFAFTTSFPLLLTNNISSVVGMRVLMKSELIW